MHKPLVLLQSTHFSENDPYILSDALYTAKTYNYNISLDTLLFHSETCASTSLLCYEWNKTAAFKQCISTKAHISDMALFTHLNPPQFCGSEIKINEIKSLKIKVCYSESGQNHIFLGMPTLTLHSSNTHSRT